MRKTALAMTVAALAWTAAAAHAAEERAAYVLGPDDQITIHALLAPEIADKAIRIESDGWINLPLAGRVKAGGMTASQLEQAIVERLKAYLEQPQVSIDITEMKSQPVSVLGAVKSPGVYQLRGPKSLVEVLSLAGGVEADAGYSVRISRRVSEGALPLPNAQRDDTGEFVVAEVALEDVMDGRHAASTLAIQPHDVIMAPRARLVYAIGEVKKPGGFVLREKQTVSVLQVLALAEGLSRTAGGGSARVLRPNPAGGRREEIPVNLNRLMAGKCADVALRPDDILFVPNSMAKSGFVRAMEAAIQVGSGMAIWR
jgi:polysaccharide export outer membrane protein